MAPKWSVKRKSGVLLRKLRKPVPHTEASREKPKVKKRPAAANMKKPSYVPASQRMDADLQSTRLAFWKNTETTLDDLLCLSEKKLLQKLWQGGHLTKPKHCTHEGCRGKLGPLKMQRGSWQWRCSAKSCHKYVLPCSNSRVFHTRTPLREQVGALFHAIWGTQQSFVPAFVRGATSNVAERVYKDWRQALASYVDDKQKAIEVRGTPSHPAQFEVDEGCFGLEERGDGTAGSDVRFTEYVAMKIRGQPESLHVSRRDPDRCYSKRKREWRMQSTTVYTRRVGSLERPASKLW